VKEKPIHNLAASVYDRLLKRTRSGAEDFQFVLMRYGAERLMYRLSESQYSANFVLKGAMLFLVWTGAQYRATKDLDLLALQSASVERLREVFRELCQLPVAPDGLVFEADNVQAEDIREDSLYHGVRVTLLVGAFGTDHQFEIQGREDPVDPGQAGGRGVRLDLRERCLGQAAMGADPLLGQLPFMTVPSKNRPQLLGSPGNEISRIR
jgi:hypothetical protein